MGGISKVWGSVRRGELSKIHTKSVKSYLNGPLGVLLRLIKTVLGDNLNRRPTPRDAEKCLS